MDFERSTQAKSWLFNEESLATCRAKAVIFRPDSNQRTKKARKFASGFHKSDIAAGSRETGISSFSLNVQEQECMIHFHAHHIQTLVGPAAVLDDLRTSVTVLSTAITYFRRFYLSNSVLEFNPRKMAVACAFFAAKVEEEKVEVGLLAHATSVLQTRFHNAPLCRNELCRVSVADIEAYERYLMEGLNYEFICHHPFPAMHALALDFTSFLSYERTAPGHYPIDNQVEDILDQASVILQRAMIFSDVQFLFSPGHIGFAVVAIALGCSASGLICEDLLDYVCNRFARKTMVERDCFLNVVGRVIRMLYGTRMMDLTPPDRTTCHVVAHRAEEMKRVLRKVSTLRMDLLRRSASWAPAASGRKRSRLELDFTPPRKRPMKVSAKVTPLRHY